MLIKQKRTIEFSTKLNAGALYYAILVSFLVALMSVFLMLNVWYHHFHTMLLIQNQKLERNVKYPAIAHHSSAPIIYWRDPT